MTYIGIDFSLNSPGLCIKNNNKYKFISFYNNKGRDPSKPTLKAFKIHKELESKEILELITYNRKVSSKDFLTREREKLVDAKMLAGKIIKKIKSICNIKETIIILEGFSYGSKGNSFIDMIQYNTFLRYELFNVFKEDKIFIFQPSHVKKNAGKGNANKNYMLKAFQENLFNDLNDNLFWKWCKGKSYPKNKIPKPIDDLVDSYFLIKSLELKLNEI